MSLFRKSFPRATVVALIVSAGAHAIPITRALYDLAAMREFGQLARRLVQSELSPTMEVALEEPPPPEAPAPEAPPVPAPAAPPKAEAKTAPAPPAAAQAGKTMTNDDAHAPVDFTVVQGANDSYVGGVTASNGTGTAPVYDRGARAGGVQGGTPGSTGTAPPANRARPAAPASFSWNCSPLFPAEADAEDINTARVTIVVSVRPDGSVAGVSVLNDPGHGFGRAARTCALSQKFTPALDSVGQTTAGKTAPISVLFTR